MGQCNVETVSPVQWQGLRVVLSKNFSRATFFIFSSTQMVDMYLSYMPMKQAQCDVRARAAAANKIGKTIDMPK